MRVFWLRFPLFLCCKIHSTYIQLSRRRRKIGFYFCRVSLDYLYNAHNYALLMISIKKSIWLFLYRIHFYNLFAINIHTYDIDYNAHSGLKSPRKIVIYFCTMTSDWWGLFWLHFVWMNTFLKGGRKVDVQSVQSWCISRYSGAQSKEGYL